MCSGPFPKEELLALARSYLPQKMCYYYIEIYLPVLSSIFVLESMEVFGLPGIGGRSGTMVGTAIDPAVILSQICIC